MFKDLPVILLKGLVLLPFQEVKLDLNNELSKEIIALSSKKYKNEILIVCPKDFIEENPDVSDLPEIGVVGHIKSKMQLGDDEDSTLRITITGRKRVCVDQYFNLKSNEDILMAQTHEVDLPKFSDIEIKAVKIKLLDILDEYVSMPQHSNSILSSLKKAKDLDKMTDMITSFIPFGFEKKLGYMQEVNALKRAKSLVKDISIELEVQKIDDRIDESVRIELENSQKDFILKEKIKKIKKELGEENVKESEIQSFYNIVNNLNIENKSKEKLISEIKKYEYTSEVSPDASIIRNYLDWTLNLPWNKYTKDEDNLKKIKKSLDATHYGMDEIKNRILEYIAVKSRNPEIKSPIICLVGPTGVGKTTLSMGIAKALNKEFYKISVGGLNDSGELIGHRRTYLGANPGKIIQGIKKCNSANPLILIDEVDKMVKDFKGDPASCLLDILDPDQNKYFTDNYIEEPFDLSKVLFILTANNIYDIPSALYDRLEIITLSSYTQFEKLDIAKKYLLPNLYKEHIVNSKQIKFSDEILLTIINKYTKESGVRELERQLDKIIRKVIIDSIYDKKEIKVTINKTNIKKYLGLAKYDENNVVENQKVGLVNALAYTPLGGLVSPIEAVMYDGRGELNLTGSLGEIMKESAEVAISYIKANKDKFKINEDIFINKDIHLHAFSGEVKKDGPSAGVSIVTCLLSIILNKKIDKNIAMTGEITLRGDILKIGGVKEKIIGAYNDGINKIFIPQSNKLDIEGLPDKIKENVEIILVKDYMDIYKNLFK